MSPEATTPPIRGSHNLLLLGFLAVTIAVITTAVELTIYHTSGDIYLDRSRPGYLPDQDEVEEENKSNPTYSYSDTGPLNQAELKTYVDELTSVKQHIGKLANPYGAEPLSDESLGIRPKANPEKEKE